MSQRSTSADGIRALLIARLAALLGASEAEVAGAETIDELGVDSLTVARLAEEIRASVGTSLPPMLFYEVRGLDELVARIVSAASIQAAEPPRPTVAIAASFTVEPIAEPLGFLLHRAGLPNEFTFAPYNQVVQQLLDPAAAFGREPAVARLVLIRVEDWFRHATDPLTADDLGRIVAHFSEALGAARARFAGPLIVALCPRAGVADPLLEWADRQVAAAAERLAGVDLADLRALGTGLSGAVLHDAARDRLGHIPYSAHGFAALAMALGRQLHRLMRPAAKVVVVDCDETLWKGVVGEDGPGGLGFDPGHLALQDFLLERKRAGQLLAMSSKNAEAEVASVFDTRAEMRVGLADFVTHRVNWDPKPDNLRAIASELGLALDSFVFIDDSPVECAAMRAALPEVTVVELPHDTADRRRFLDAHWAFDTTGPTDEDRRRTDLYRTEREREQLKHTAASVADFLAALDIRTAIRPLEAADVPRAAQLTQRTNQFNTTTIRRDEAAVSRLLGATPPRALTVHVHDGFGDYGFVGLAVLDWSPARCTVELLLLSCRVLGRRVEHALLLHIAELAQAEGVGSLDLRVAASARNQPAQRFLAGLGDGSGGRVVLDTGDVAAVLSRSEEIGTATGNAGAAAPAERPIAPSLGLAELAALSDSAALVDALATGLRRLRPGGGAAGPAVRSPLETEIAQIWCEVLRLDRVGIDEDFFALGGDSLSCTDMAARLYDIGLPEHVGIGIMDRPTVSGLAQAIEDARHGRAPRLVGSLGSLEAAAQLPAEVRHLCSEAGRSYRPAPVRTYLLTGATGYVGAHLAAELLAQPGVRLVCHLRARDEASGWARLRANFVRYGLWQPDLAARLSIVRGALESPRMGIADMQYEQLAHEVDAVVHNGARVNFILPYPHLYGANVFGTIEALRFAAHGTVKPLHFVSTLGVLMSGYPRDRVIAEDAELDRSEDLPNGYEQTKWVADKLVWHAIRAGYPAAIYRLGMVSGESRSGTYHKLDEFLPSFLKGCIQLGAFPHLDSKIEMVPVDVATRALAGIVAQQRAIGRVFHLNHPRAISDAAFVAWIQGYGFKLRFLPWDVWKQELFGDRDHLRGNALFPFLDFIRGLQSHQTRIPEMDMANVFDLAAEEIGSCPGQTVLLRRYFDQFVAVGYLSAPGIARLAEVAE